MIGQLVLGLLIALAVQRGTARRLPGTVFVRSVVLCSWVMPGVVIGILWQIVLNDGAYGLVNAVLLAFGLPAVSFLATPTLALVSVTLANIWRGTAFSMLLQYAGLQGINPEVYEAARMDGAGRWKSFWYITLPLLRPIIALNVILITISTLNTFDMVLALTGGGPGQSTEVLSLFIYNTIFRNQDLAGGSVLAVFLLADQPVADHGLPAPAEPGGAPMSAPPGSPGPRATSRASGGDAGRRRGSSVRREAGEPTRSPTWSSWRPSSSSADRCCGSSRSPSRRRPRSTIPPSGSSRRTRRSRTTPRF